MNGLSFPYLAVSHSISLSVLASVISFVNALLFCRSCLSCYQQCRVITLDGSPPSNVHIHTQTFFHPYNCSVSTMTIYPLSLPLWWRACLFLCLQRQLWERGPWSLPPKIECVVEEEPCQPMWSGETRWSIYTMIPPFCSQ